MKIKVRNKTLSCLRAITAIVSLFKMNLQNIFKSKNYDRFVNVKHLFKNVYAPISALILSISAIFRANWIFLLNIARH